MDNQEIQENVVKAVENCGLAIYKNAPKIVGNYQYQTGAVTISISIDGNLKKPIATIKVQNEFLNILDSNKIF
ncbi:hypothetical protein G6Z84_03020 [Lactobacillus iners]|uniref:hypothetical protein n=1 Tax=Lactobacillus iners TaxID=147802 RepID=UPI0013E12534|nr:hypothetical protein [Lactobacillus iners]MCT7775437.1 hypothetical protein [Lactobacillus iners]MCT7824469.1 hypothetical protein [Lactobacillus crispatus]QIH25010.1 hypothetical protein G6Z84_03020 [Lactobacillus iners]